MQDKANQPRMAGIIERNISALLERRKHEERNKTREEKIADKITCFTGNMLFVYIHLVVFGGWILWNLGVFGLPPFDPSFVVLAMIASVEAIFLSTFVLITQNRMNAQADKRAELDLQISLLTEHEVTKLIALISEMARKMDIKNAYDSEIEELSQDVYPEKVMDTMEKARDEEEKADAGI